MAVGVGMPAAADTANTCSGGYCVSNITSPELSHLPPSLPREAGQGVMHLTEDQKAQIRLVHLNLPKYTIPVQNRTAFVHEVSGSANLLPYLTYNATERDQGWCGNCYAWATTAALEIYHAVHDGVYDRLSIQYFDAKHDSILPHAPDPHGNDSACNGGNDNEVATEFNQFTNVVPWSNDNAYWADADNNPVEGIPLLKTQLANIQTAPAYAISNAQIYTWTTDPTDQAGMITDIKDSLNSNTPVIMWFNFNDAAFNKYWNDEDSSAILDPATINVDPFDACHYVIIVGYDDTGNQDTSYWTVLNSWGAPSNRPDGTFKLKMYMNYNLLDDGGNTTYAFDFVNSADFASVHAPQVTEVSPNNGPLPGGSEVSITGIGFTGATDVKFGGVPATSFTVTSDSTILAIAPDGSGATASSSANPEYAEEYKTVDVTVTSPKGDTSATSPADLFLYMLPPTIDTISPGTGPASGGTVVTISGTNLDNATSVNFGNAPATDLNVLSRQCRLSFFGVVCIQPGSAESIQVTSPDGTAGSADITVTAPGGTSRVVPADEFTYNADPAIFSVTPNNGPAGTVVKIMGHAFDNSSTVSFGGVAATNVTYTPRCAANICIDGLTVTVPPEQVLTQYLSGGQVDITVTTAERGTSDISPQGLYSYNTVQAPVITGVSPGTGVPGTTVNITGTNLGEATEVDFGGKPATNLSVIPDCNIAMLGTCLMGRGNSGQASLQVTVPTAPYTITSTSASGQTVDVQVTTQFGGTSATAPADQFTYFEIPIERSTHIITGSIAVTSDPAGAAIVIDGTLTGQKTPYTFTNITPGEYKVGVRLEKNTPQTRDVTVNPFETATADFSFSGNTAPSLDAYLTSVRYSRFTNETELVFPTPTVTEQFVEHPVNLKPVYFTPSPTATPVSTIYIPHEATTLHIAQPGSLAVTSTPSGAEVWVNGVDTGQTTLAMLAEDAGSYQVLVKLDCYGVPDTQTVTVYAGQETNATFSLTRLDTCPIKPVVISPVRYAV